MFSSSLFTLLALVQLVTSVPHDHVLHRREHDHIHREETAGSLPDIWFHDADHPAHALFKRGTDGGTYPDVGSPEWAAKYPTEVPDVSKLPKEWTDALAAAIAAGKIPDIPKTTASDDLGPVYPEGTNAEDPSVCSATAKCRIEGDIWDAPDGVFALNFDDGPQPASPKLTEFLTQNQKTATHFLIGLYITQQPNEFMGIFNAGSDLAVHTYTHPYMTSQSNEEVLAQVGWTMQIIHDSTGGRVPKYWRPPYGDTDHRVRAITREVFGLEVIMWNYDTDDWALTTGGQTSDKIATDMNGWLTGPKSPGLIILEHELSDQSVQAFIDAYPLIEQNGWNMMSAAKCYSDTAYHNAASSTSDQVTPAGILLSEQQSSAPPASSSSTSSTDSASSSSQSSSSSKTSSSTSTSSTASPSSGSSTEPQGDSTAGDSAASLLTSPLSYLAIFGALAMLL